MTKCSGADLSQYHSPIRPNGLWEKTTKAELQDKIHNLEAELEVWKTIATWTDAKLQARLEAIKKDRSGFVDVPPIPTDRKGQLAMLEEWEGPLDDYVG